MTAYEILSTVIVAILGSTLLNTLVSRIFDRADKKKDKTNCIKDSLQLILLDMLNRQGKVYIEQGYITRSQWETYEEAYHLYHDADKLGGNGYAKRVYEGVQKLEITTDDY